ncbi:hypothetical protein M404DRAFT_536491 [Pisolithus tinctorius Marx 270]|uniref:Uncharacterized protein n=1 Tax=Pisolithus tinctorius Marx 270 TaxID=870435 RepID=A0A0C3J681_PISTI|nr:hypothetical protein M404DRAFT_536491 [Pisolithus tinctorius Marx 270]
MSEYQYRLSRIKEQMRRIVDLSKRNQHLVILSTASDRILTTLLCIGHQDRHSDDFRALFKAHVCGHLWQGDLLWVRYQHYTSRQVSCM